MNNDWQAATAGWLKSLRAAGRPETTIKLRRYQIGRLADAMAPAGPWDVTRAALEDWLGGQDGWQSRETLRSFRSAVRSFYRWAHGMEFLERDPSLLLPSVKPNDPSPRPTPEDAYRDAMAGADERVRLMLRLAAELGMRRGEVARCHRDDVERDLAGWSMRIRGKGARIRRVPLTDALAARIRLFAGPSGWVFPGNDGGHLSPHYVGRLVARALPGAWAMHSLRHRFCTAAFAYDRDLLTVQALAGHASPVTTRLYILVPDDSLRRTVAAVAAL